MGGSWHNLNAHLRQPPKQLSVGVLRTIVPLLIILEAEGASADGLCSPSECLIAQAWVWDQPIEVFLGQRFLPIATVIQNPLGVLVVALSLHNCGLVDQHFQSLVSRERHAIE